MIAGRIVQIVSIICASEMFREEKVLKIKASRAEPTKVMIRIKIVMAWSWNIMSCDIIGEDAS